MRAVLAVVALAAGCATACSTTVAGSPVPAHFGDEALIARYFSEFGKSAEEGAAAQRDFLRKTQHPDYTDRLCDLQGAIITVDPTMATLRQDPDWSPEAGRKPRGSVYVVAVSLTITKDGKVLGDQIGSERVVVLDGAVYGFMPCFREN
ncbi:hypothetical protein JOF56_002561 [Kibdelosporangium banguiense]|uniref:Lipoprotein n=1 Tax=Kibdelosporangium banguiense TaxID=1365924 RepID=A0ABS4TCW1_9PSEU|nr:hypothetical protein [Kibdelosporangium banguiense]MBP2322176.1 hypothetical protein [Kibdelosporangium banguiense]